MTSPVRLPGFEYMDLADFEELLADKPSHEKWELLGGRVVKMMVGARWSHHRIIQNVNVHLTNALRANGSPCRVYTETFCLKERFIDLAAFPDVMVHCGLVGRDAASVSDPIILFEVVSPGSVARDRQEKSSLYSRLPSLRQYVMIERDLPIVDVLYRADERSWEARRLETLDATLSLPTLGLDLPLAEIYRDVIEA